MSRSSLFRSLAAAAIVITAGPGCLAQEVSPEEVVRLALQAQADGRVDDMLGYFAMDRFAESSRQLADRRIRALMDGRTFFNFNFRHLATSESTEGKLRAVRVEVSYEIALGGNNYAVSEGLMAVLIDKEGAWKILWIAPDEIHDLALYEASLPVPEEGVAMERRTAGTTDYRELDAYINESMRTNRFNEKAILDATMSATGQLPVIGDSIAVTYQVFDTLGDAADVLKEAWNYGTSGMLPLKVKKLAVGIVQIVVEPLPFLDAQADAIAILDDQLIYNFEIRRALAQLRIDVKNAGQGQLRANPRLYLLKDLTEWHYPAGIELAPDQSALHSYGAPVAQIAFTAPDAYGRHIPFRVAGEIGMEEGSPAAPFAASLGGEKRGDRYYFPVDLTHLVLEDVSRGDTVLDSFGRFRTAGGVRMVSWDATCRRGRQELSVKLRSGEETPVLPVLNRLMNSVTELRVASLWPEGSINMEPGDSRGPFEVIAWSPAIQNPALYPNVTTWGACFDTTVADGSVAALTRAESISLKGVKNGSTVWQLLLGGSAVLPEVKDVALAIPITVGPNRLKAIQEMASVEVSIHGDHMFDNQTGTLRMEWLSYGNYYNRSTDFGVKPPAVPVRWSGTKFLADGTMNNGSLKIHIEGEMNASGTEVLSIAVAWDYKASWEQHFSVKVRGPAGIPAVTTSSAIGTFSLTANVPAYISELNETYRSGNIFRNYKQTDWSNQNIKPEIRIEFRK